MFALMRSHAVVNSPRRILRLIFAGIIALRRGLEAKHPELLSYLTHAT